MDGMGRNDSFRYPPCRRLRSDPGAPCGAAWRYPFLKKRDHRIGQRRGLPVGVVFGIVGVTGCRSMTREGFVAACCEGYEAKVYGFAWGLSSLCKIVSVPIKGRLPCGLGRTRN